MSNSKKKIILVFLGPPASGKGTQADMLGKSLDLPVISAGELLRQEQAQKTKNGQKVSLYLKQGELVPDKLIQKILSKRLEQNDVARGFILDGYPRRFEQIQYLEKIKKQFLSADDIFLVFYIDVSDKEAKERVTGRRVCQCGAAYHLKYNPPKNDSVCDVCGRKIYRRQDDEPEIIEHRLKDFHQRIEPILKYFQDKKTLIKINGEQGINNINISIKQKINALNLLC